MNKDSLFMFRGDTRNREIALLISACSICAVREDLWDDVLEKYLPLAYNFFRDTYSATDRLKMLCNTEFDITLSDSTTALVDKCDLWYSKVVFEALGIEKTVKLLTYISEKHVKADTKVLNFKDLLEKMYYYPNNERTIDYCSIAMINEAIEGNDKHCKIVVSNSGNSLNISANFSATGLGIDSFYRNVNHDDIHHRKAVLMMLDYFGYRSDSFDRLGNEKEYLQTMNSSIGDKAKILGYINADDSVLEVGPGGGALMKLISRITPDVSCIDISKEVCNRLEDIARTEGYPWNIIYGDFFTMDTSEKYDKIIFCSNIHEMFSFIEYDGKRFNKEIIPAIILKAKDLLNEGGQIIIRDGIASDDNSECSLMFHDNELLRLFHEYRKHFKGFDLDIKDVSETEFKMPYNSMMESIFTITWGEDSLPFEVEEWYGYYSRKEWYELLPIVNMTIACFDQYLQDGYKEHLDGKISLNDAKFPNSNCFVVLEK